MITNVTALSCVTFTGAEPPRGAPEPKPAAVRQISISAAASSSTTNHGRGFATRAGAIEAAQAKLGIRAKLNWQFILLQDTPRVGRWSWAVRNAPPRHRPDGLKTDSVEAKMVDMALRPQGVARAELREALGWKSDPYGALVAACDHARVSLTVIREGKGPFRYIGRYE